MTIEPDKRVSPGDVVGDKYRVEQLLAVGGMGVVALARHIELEHEVAIKLVLGSDKEHIARFLREARAAANLHSEHVARVYDHGRLADGTPYIVMERLHGSDLRQLLRKRGPLPVSEAVDMMLEVLQGVGEAHALGIVHRDLKPANLFCVEHRGRRSMKVLDFGISKSSLDAADDQLTRTDAMLGSPGYVAPEQARSSRNVDARADIWSLGVVLYELLDGTSPFAGATLGETLSNILTLDPIPLSALRPDVSESLSLVVARCLERDRDKRYASVAELARDLAPFASERARENAQHVAEVPLAPVADHSAIDIATRSSWVHSTPEHPRRRRGVLLILAGAVIGAAVATLTVMKLLGEPTLAALPGLADDLPSVAVSVEDREAAAPVTPPSASVATPPKPRTVVPRRAPKRDLLDTSN